MFIYLSAGSKPGSLTGSSGTLPLRYGPVSEFFQTISCFVVPAEFKFKILLHLCPNVGMTSMHAWLRIIYLVYIQDEGIPLCEPKKVTNNLVLLIDVECEDSDPIFGSSAELIQVNVILQFYLPLHNVMVFEGGIWEMIQFRQSHGFTIRLMSL